MDGFIAGVVFTIFAQYVGRKTGLVAKLKARYDALVAKIKARLA